MTKEQLTQTFKIRLTPSTLSRWQASAKQANLPLSVYIRKRVDGCPVLPPKVPAANAMIAVRLGNIEIQLRQLDKQLDRIATVFNEAQETEQKLPDNLSNLDSLWQLKELLNEQRVYLKKISLQLNGIEEIENEEIFDREENLSKFDLEEIE
jgi:hypothetical protein